MALMAGRARHSVRAVVVNPNAYVGNSGGQRTGPPYLANRPIIRFMVIAGTVVKQPDFRWFSDVFHGMTVKDVGNDKPPRRGAYAGVFCGSIAV
jgi:hypothetical protein